MGPQNGGRYLEAWLLVKSKFIDVRFNNEQ